MTRSYGDPVQVGRWQHERSQLERSQLEQSQLERAQGSPGDPDASGAPGGQGPAPDCFRWRGRRYVVRLVLAHWIEVGPWWRAASALDLEAAGAGDGAGEAASPRAEREVWRVEAAPDPAVSPGVYDLARDGAGGWRLVRTID